MDKILVVDDEEMVRDMMKKGLEECGYAVDVASNGNEALKLFADNKYDVVITDILMPEREGIETIQEMVVLDRSIRIIAMSGGGKTMSPDFLRIAKEFGACATLRKPFRRDDLIRTINSVLADDTAELC